MKYIYLKDKYTHTHTHTHTYIHPSTQKSSSHLLCSLSGNYNPHCPLGL